MIQVLVNGQQLLIPSDAEWAEILRGGELNGRQTSATFLWSVQRCLPVVAQYAELSLTILDLDGCHFFTKVFLGVADYKQRVFLEELQCIVCNWSGWTADPLVEDNYIGLPWDLVLPLIQKAMTFPLSPCPTCGAKLPRRHPIWVAY
ncbi:hypothetical protein GO988_20760 [Hymenobacter sp. HMF4947]|uniref:Uncharacterized protein n=1 Tax=Hymenobacter ginkgonis TaxID=2682976 RepID=A0A7K1TK76_9BACT|nr:hypothetical protein [Hymenobacter ginkgonis]MVN78772.1 hypothetical protein [Hymenobacter ginkgonis]